MTSSMKTHTRMPIELATLCALFTGVALSLGCFGDQGGDGGENNSTQTRSEACPFTFATPTLTLDEPDSPALLTFPIFEEGELEWVGADGRDVQLIVQSIQPFVDSDGRQDRTPSITYIQNTDGPFVLFAPDEVAGEYDRIATNAQASLGATTSNTTIELGGESANVLVARADASIVATVFVPLDGGAFFAPVSLGVYAGRAGCQTTMESTFTALLEGVALNADSTFGELTAVTELKAQKAN